MRGLHATRWVAVLAVISSGCEAFTGVDFGAVRSLDDLCVLKKPPSPPAFANSGDDLEQTVVLVDYDFGEQELEDGTPGYLTIGYDLDDSCTLSPDDQPCNSPSWLNADLVDGPGGIDNGVGRMLFSQESLLGGPGFSARTFSDKVETGERAPIGVLRISDYSGYHEDDRLTVEWFVPLSPLSQDPPFEPALDGSDAWPIAEEYVVEGTRAVFTDEDAYAADDQIVARFPNILLSILGSYAEVEDVVISFQVFGGKIQDGLLAGRISEAGIWGALPVWGNVWVGAPLCRGTLGPDLKSIVCTMVDLPPAGADGVCENISFGMHFDTRPVTLGAASPLPAAEDVCEEEGDFTGERCADPPE